MMFLRIAIIDPNELSRHGLQHLLQDQGRSVKIYACPSGFETTHVDHPFHLVLLDDAPFTAAELWQLLERWQQLPAVGVILVSGNLSTRYVQQLIRHGIAGYIARHDLSRTTLHACLATVSQRQVFISPHAATELYRRDLHALDLGLRRVDLDVLYGLVEGLNIQEIALRLGLNDAAIYRARNRLRKTLGAPTNEQLIIAAARQGLLDL